MVLTIKVLSIKILVHPNFGLLNCANLIAGGRTTDSSPIFCTRILVSNIQVITIFPGL